MRASVHIADLGAKSLIAAVRQRPRQDEVPGLASSRVAPAAALRTSAVPSVSPGRLALVAFWEDEAALDDFEANHPFAQLMAGGWSVRLEPLRRWGTWPGLPESVPTERSAGREVGGPYLVLTLGRTRMSQIVRFLRTSQGAEQAALTSPGLIWGTALARPPFLGTCSLWDSVKSIATYAYGRSEPAHDDAIRADEGKPFHHEQAFIRFRPYASKGELTGENALPADWAAGSERIIGPAAPAESA